MPDPMPGQTPENEQEVIVDDYSRDEQSQKIIRFLGKLKADEIFSSDENKRQFIKGLDFESFKNLLFSINAILRDISVKKRATDGENVYLKGFIESDIPPKHNDKEELLAKVFKNAKDMNAEGRDLKDIALLIGVSVNALHLFNDANGRTSRIVYTLLAHEFSGVEKEVDYLKKILGKYGREIIDINPSILLSNEVEPLIEDEIRDSVNPKPWFRRGRMYGPNIRQSLEDRGFAEDDIGFMIKSEEDHRCGFLALEKYLFAKGSLAEYVESFDKNRPDRSDINYDRVIRDLTPEDVEGIKSEYWNLKKHKVEILIDIISNPENYSSREKPGKTAKEFFEEEIAEKSSLNDEDREQ